MPFVFFVVWTVLLGGQGVWSLDADGVEWDFGTSKDEKSLFFINVKGRDPLPRTCRDVNATESRVVVTLSDGLEVLCDTKTDGGGWLIFQRRLSADVDFFQNWVDYKYGFGDIRGNFWLGNEKIYRLTSIRRYKLRVEFTYAGRSYFAEYSKFRIFGEAENYKIEIGGYSGNAGDSMGTDTGMAFSTKDRDNDASSQSHCAVLYHGAWWYQACHTSNLNGEYVPSKSGSGLTWGTTTWTSGSATSTEMKLKLLY